MVSDTPLHRLDLAVRRVEGDGEIGDFEHGVQSWPRRLAGASPQVHSRAPQRHRFAGWVATKRARGAIEPHGARPWPR